MSKAALKLQIVSLAIFSLPFAAQAAQTVITFEDGADAIFDLDGYHGISGWNSVGAVRESGYGTGIGDYYFQAQAGGELSFDMGPVVFEGMYYNSWSTAGLIPSYDLFYQNNLVFTGYVDTNNQPLGLYWLGSGYSGKIDRISFYAGGDGVAFDNFTFTTTAVPEPLTSAMLLAGLMLVGACVKQRRYCGRPETGQADHA